MSKSFSKAFYNSKQWQQCRTAYISSVYGLCAMCDNEPGLIVHHKIALNSQNINNPDITLNFDNLTLLCLKHHNEIHGKQIEKRYMFDKNGDVIPINNNIE
jgi:hypothetical protein